LTNKAKDATQKAESQISKSIRDQSKAKQKVSIFKGENFDLKTKRMTKQWEEMLVRKHELWESYKAAKKNFFVTVTNAKIHKRNLKAADNNVMKLIKIHALNPKDVGIKKRIEEAKSSKIFAMKQLEAARNAKNKQE
jgi:SUMO ligase MMS21 Smc5/6 complex component